MYKVTGYVRQQTDLAILFSPYSVEDEFKGDADYTPQWISKSQLDDIEYWPDELVTLTMPQWLIEEKELEDFAD